MSEISHKAKIVKVNDYSVEAEIEVQSACAQCALQQACQMHETSKRKIVVPIENEQSFQIGDEVNVAISLVDSAKVTFFAYLLPLFLVLGTLLICLACEKSEIISGICSIIVLIPYYFGVFLKKNFFARKLSFKIVDKD